MANKLVLSYRDLEQLSGISNAFIKRATDNLRVSLSSLSDKNKRDYEATMRMWSNVAKTGNFNPFDFDLTRVENFLKDNDWSFNTRKTRLAHIRKFAELFALADENNEYGYSNNFGRLSLLKPKSLGGKKAIQKTTTLSSKQIYRLFDAIAGDSNRNTRNRAILGVMLLAGLRSSEVVALKWEHINFIDNLIFVFEGKGDKSANVPMLGDLPLLLARWRSYQGRGGLYEYVFTPIFRSDKLCKDGQPTTRMVRTFIQWLNLETGIQFNPHDTRRTALTALLDNGASVPEARDFARHSSGETTLRYAAKNEAMSLGVKLSGKLKYGGVLGDIKPNDMERQFECDNGHKFYAESAEICIFCHSDKLSHQKNLFDE